MRFVALLALLVACGDDAAGEPDATSAAIDALTADATPAVPLSGFGTITGDCGVLDDELTSPSPSSARGAIEFSREFVAADTSMLSSGAQKIIEDGTHESLLDINGHYAKLWSMQAGGFLPEAEAHRGADD